MMVTIGVDPHKQTHTGAAVNDARRAASST